MLGFSWERLVYRLKFSWGRAVTIHLSKKLVLASELDGLDPNVITDDFYIGDRLFRVAKGHKNEAVNSGIARYRKEFLEAMKSHVIPQFFSGRYFLVKSMAEVYQYGYELVAVLLSFGFVLHAENGSLYIMTAEQEEREWMLPTA